MINSIILLVYDSSLLVVTIGVCLSLYCFNWGACKLYDEQKERKDIQDN